MQTKFRTAFADGSPGVVKQYLTLLLENITPKGYGNDLEVVGRTSGLVAAVESENEKRTADLATVRSSSLKWRPICDVSANYMLRFSLECKSPTTGELRFSRLQVLNWMDELVELGRVGRWSMLAGHLEVGEEVLVEYLEAA